MSFRIIITDFPSQAVHSELPIHYRGPILRGSKIHSINYERSELLCQELNYGDLAIRLFSGNNIREFEFRDEENNGGLRVCFMIENSIRKNISDIEKIHLPEDHHLIMTLTKADHKISIGNEKQFQFLEISYSKNLLEEFSPTFPILEKIIKQNDCSILSRRTFWTSLRIKEIYSQLIYSDYDEHLQPLYFGLKLREIFFHLLRSSLNLQYHEIQFTPYEIARIYEAKSLLEKYIDRKPPTIKELSKMVALNEFKLKQGFKKFFNSGIFEWISTEKMYRAKKLLEETNKPIKEVAALSGYPRTTNFITVFRKQFGITPGAIRRSKS